MNPRELFDTERSAAFEAKDPTAAVCSVANVDDQGRVQIRTLVLRNVEQNLALFVNASSPKWQSLRGNQFAIMTYWPSQQIQYRIQVTATELDPAIVHDSWLLRPAAPKKMDWFYQKNQPQSSAITNREDLLSGIEALELAEPLAAPPGARGLILNLHEIERLDLNQSNGVHDRTRYIRTSSGPADSANALDGKWQSTTLVP